MGSIILKINFKHKKHLTSNSLKKINKDVLSVIKNKKFNKLFVNYDLYEKNLNE
jgi:hypothetical protein